MVSLAVFSFTDSSGTPLSGTLALSTVHPQKWSWNGNAQHSPWGAPPPSISARRGDWFWEFPISSPPHGRGFVVDLEDASYNDLAQLYTTGLWAGDSQSTHPIQPTFWLGQRGFCLIPGNQYPGFKWRIVSTR